MTLKERLVNLILKAKKISKKPAQLFLRQLDKDYEFQRKMSAPSKEILEHYKKVREAVNK